MSSIELELFEFTRYGKDYIGYFKIGKYWINNALALSIMAKEKESIGSYEVYCKITVNLPVGQMENHIFLDINNCPFAEDLFMRYGFGLPTGYFGHSGFVNYPEYIINRRNIERYSDGKI